MACRVMHCPLMTCIAVVAMQDVVCASSTAGAELVAFVGKGDGSFAPGVASSGLPVQAFVIASGSFNPVYMGGQGQVAGYSVAADGVATLINSQSTQESIIAIILDASEDWLLSASFGNSIESHGINQATGVIGPRVHFVSATTSGMGPGGLVMAPDNSRLVAASPAAGRVALFDFNSTTGVMSSSVQDFPAGALPRGVVVFASAVGNADFRFTYAVPGAGGNTLTLLLGDGAGPKLSYFTFFFGDGREVPCYRPSAIAAADLDSDGDMDLVVGCQGDSGDEQHHLFVLLNRGGLITFSISQL